MKITQEQIDAALRYADCKETNEDLQALHDLSNRPINYSTVSMQILAAAYRAKCEEVELLKRGTNQISDPLGIGKDDRIAIQYECDLDPSKFEVKAIKCDDLITIKITTKQP